MERASEKGPKRKRNMREKEIEESALEKKGEQYHFLRGSCLIGSLCVKLDAYLFLNTNLILPFNCP